MILSILETNGKNNGDEMVTERNQIKLSEEQEALNSVQEMENAARRQAIPPRWFGAIIALLCGGLVTLSAAGLNTYSVYLIIMMTLVIVYQSQKATLSIRPFSSKVAGIAVISGFVALFFVLIIAAQAVEYNFGFVWSPLAAGAIFAIAVYMLTVSERHEHESKIGKENTNGQ